MTNLIEPSATLQPLAPPSGGECQVFDWIENFGRYTEDIPSFVREVCNRFVGCDMPLDRVSIVMRTLHPQISTSGYMWRDGVDELSLFTADHQTQTRESYQRSPVRLIFEGSPGLRRRLADPDCPRDFPVLIDLDGEGVTDYLILPIPFSDGRSYACSWATKAPGGFTDAQIGRIQAVMPTFSLVLEILAARDISHNLMDTYLGHKTGERVLNGGIYRGVNETIEAALWISDLRGFTALSDKLAPPVLLGILNDHFERIVGAIEKYDGEVLKFIGDSVLAIFPIDQYGDAMGAAEAAVGAAREAVRRLEERNVERQEKNIPALGYGIALHMGEVVYGNIGAPNRLDFTVIGPAVNHTARIEQLCRTMSRPVLISATVAEATDQPVTSLGFHALRGVREPHEIFTLPEYA
ncbi:MAG: adenylate/guanylate cyclase domain-containing protein [Alphaproteobacteria bacterium]|nr:adenylate/guanylate cyclase domain-containing protein [Alphaproteobacteria bacterium]